MSHRDNRVGLGGLTALVLSLLVAMAVTGNTSGSCLPSPEDVVCTSNADCPDGSLCGEEGHCTDCPPVACELYCPYGFAKGDDGCPSCTCIEPDFTSCDVDDDCVKVSEGCCPCSNGGTETAVNEAMLPLFQAPYDCSLDLMCMTVYLCTDQVAACVDGECQLVEADPEPTAECASHDDCVVSGCSGQLCTKEPMASTCEWLDWYGCFHDESITTCGCFEGACGWEQTDALAACIGGGSF